jgi:phosphotransferase system enzyme I (PtsI)
VAVIREDRVNAEWALREVSEQLHEMFDGFTDAYFRERSTDLDDVLGRIQLNLGGAPTPPA